MFAHMFTVIIVVCSKFCLDCILCTWPYVMHGLRLFIVVLQELHCLLRVCIIRVRGWHHITKFYYSTPSGF